MRLLKLSWNFVILLLFLCPDLEASQLILSKRENGSGRCPIDSLLTFSRSIDRKHEIGFRVNIKNVSPPDVQGCSFPWIIKAFLDDRELAKSEEINYEDFFSNPTNNRLLSVDALITLNQLDLYQFSQPCFTNECHDLLTTLSITFALFSESGEIDTNCSLFDDPSLEPNSTKAQGIIHFMSCFRHPMNNTSSSISDGIRDENTRKIDGYQRIAGEASESVQIHRESQFEKNQVRINQDVKIYPNPSNGIINLEFKDSPNSLNYVELINLQGFPIGTFNIRGTNSQINLQRYPPGIYIIKVIYSNSATTHRLVLRSG